MNNWESGHNQPRTRELILLLALCPALLAGCLAAPFLPYDDRDYAATEIVTGSAPLSDLFLKPAGACFPLTGLSFRLEYLFYHEFLGVLHWAPFARLSNLLLHALAGWILWRICGILRLGRFGALFVTGAFLLHPLACESVCWVSERKNTLAAPLGFGAVLALWPAGTDSQFPNCRKLASVPARWRALAAAVLYALALLSKPSALGFLPLLLALSWKPVLVRLVHSGDRQPISEKSEMGVRSCWPWPPLVFAALSAAMICFTLRAHSGMTLPPPGGSVFTAALTDAEILRRYLQNAFWPAQLSAFYEVDPILSPLDIRFLGNAGLVLAVVVLTVWSSRRRALSVFLWFWFFAVLGPVLNLVATSLLMQDRYLYFSTPALFAVVWLALEGLGQRIAVRFLHPPLREWAGGGLSPLQQVQRILKAALWGLLALLAALSACRSQVWDNPYLLFADAARKQPRSVLANLCFADTLSNLADSVEAQPPSDSKAAQALTVAPAQDQARQTEAYRLRAIQHYQGACAAPDFRRLTSPGLLYLNLAHAQERSGRPEDAIATLQALTTEPFTPPVSLEHGILAHERLAALYLQQNRAADAFAEASRALALSPDAPRALLLAGRSLETLGRPAEALAAYRRIKPGAIEREAAEERIRRLGAEPRP